MNFKIDYTGSGPINTTALNQEVDMAGNDSFGNFGNLTIDKTAIAHTSKYLCDHKDKEIIFETLNCLYI